MEFHCDKFSIQCTWLSIIKCLWQVENILKYLTLFKVILICVMTNNQFSSVTQSWLFVTPWTVACQTSLSTTNSGSLLKFMSIESVMHPTISSSVIPFFSRLQSFQMSQFFAYEFTKQQPWTSTDLAAYIYFCFNTQQRVSNYS